MENVDLRGLVKNIEIFCNGFEEFFDNTPDWRLAEIAVQAMGDYAAKHKSCRQRQGNCKLCPFNVHCDMSNNRKWHEFKLQDYTEFGTQG